MPVRSNLIGQRFHRLVVESLVENDRRKTRRWLCRCDCGRTTLVATAYLRNGQTKSCGCLAKEAQQTASLTHGMTRRQDGGRAPEYRIWALMIQRSTNPGHSDYPNYGGRGIDLCDRWRHSFPAFFEDMGPRPSPSHQIDRVDNNGDYCPENCRWATRSEQARNKRNNRLLSMGGVTKTVAEWAEITGVHSRTIRQRLHYGWSTERALTVPTRAHAESERYRRST